MSQDHISEEIQQHFIEYLRLWHRKTKSFEQNVIFKLAFVGRTILKTTEAYLDEATFAYYLAFGSTLCTSKMI